MLLTLCSYFKKSKLVSPSWESSVMPGSAHRHPEVHQVCFSRTPQKRPTARGLKTSGHQDRGAEGLEGRRGVLVLLQSTAAKLSKARVAVLDCRAIMNLATSADLNLNLPKFAKGSIAELKHRHWLRLLFEKSCINNGGRRLHRVAPTHRPGRLSCWKSTRFTRTRA